jgi:RHS repeat-associated protein
MLGSSLGVVESGKFCEIRRTSFGEQLSNSSTPELSNFSADFFTGKPSVEGLGYSFLFRNYRSETGKWQTSDPLGYPDGWNNLAYCGNRVITYFDWLGAWGENVHYGVTKTLAQKAGFTEEEAERIASANTGTDALMNGTGPWGAGTGDSSRHFDYDSTSGDSRLTHAENDLNAAVQAWLNGDQDSALDLLGRGLHSLQDIDAHRTWDPRLDPNLPDWDAHPDWMDDVTDPRNRKALKNTMKRTKDYFKKFTKMIE